MKRLEVSPLLFSIAAALQVLAACSTGVAAGTPELCGDARTITAQQIPGAVLIIAEGTHPRSGYQTRLVELPFSIYPPQFALMHIAPSTGGTLVTPFRVKAAFPAWEKVDEVTVITADGPQMIKVEQVLDTSNGAPTNIKEALEDAGNFNTLLKLFAAADLEHEITVMRWCITLLAPTDDAFAKLPKETLEQLLDPKNKDQLRKVLHYHVLAQARTREEIFEARSINTLSGQVFVRTGKGLKLGMSTPDFVDKDIRNGCSVIIPMDAVLLE